jgi:hypothetical protein
MRRPLLALVLLATIAVGWAQAAFAAVHPPSGSPQTVSAPQTGERVRYVPLAQLRPEFASARRVLG